MFATSSKFATKKSLATPMLLLGSSQRAFGGAIVKADGSHKFIAPCNKKTLALDGLRPTANQTHEINNPYRHQNDLPLWK